MKWRALPIFFVCGAAFACQSARDARTPSDASATESAGRTEPTSDKERELLKEIATLPTDHEKQVAGVSVSAGTPYFAASGYQCRNVLLQEAGRQDVRLACGDEQGWFFADPVDSPMSHGSDGETSADRAEIEIAPTGEAHATVHSASSVEGPSELGSGSQK